MNPAIDALIAIRRDGLKPSPVWIIFGEDVKQVPYWKRAGAPVEIALTPTEPFQRYDWRAVVGCDLIVLAANRCEPLKALLKILQAFAAYITLYLLELLPAAFGYAWPRGGAWRRLEA